MDEDTLFDASLKGFVDARKALAAALRADKRADVAKRVLATPKPSPAAWGLNQVARRERATLEAYLTAVDAQAEAQVRGASREQLFAAAHAERTTKKAVVDRAVHHLEADGTKPSKAVLEALPSTLQGAAMDPDAREQLAAGRLLTDVEPADFATLALLAASRGLAVADGAAAVTPSAAAAASPEEASPVPADPAPAQSTGAASSTQGPALVDPEAVAREAAARREAERVAKRAVERAALAAAADRARTHRESVADRLRGARTAAKAAADALAAAEAAVVVARERSSSAARAVEASEASLLDAETASDAAVEALMAHDRG